MKAQGLQFFRTTTRIQSGPGAFGKSRLVMTFFNLKITETLCNSRLVLEGKTGQEITELSRLEFLEKPLAQKFALSDTEDNTFRLSNRGGTADSPFLRTLLVICQMIVLLFFKYI